MFVIDPISEGFVASVARPGGNVTGLTLPAPRRLQCKWSNDLV
jgi:ABC-type uncharacterized transport system substrate-binding protein